MNILFINHGLSKSCGVHAQGVRHFESLSKSNKYNFIYCEINSFEDLQIQYDKFKPILIMYNYMPIVLPWLNSNIKSLNVKNVCLIHNITQNLVDTNQYLYDDIFDSYITLDISLNVTGNFYKTNRPVYNFNPKEENLDINNLKIGTFGFPFLHKGFDKVVNLVNSEFDNATVNLHMTDSFFCKNETEKILNLCQNSITKPGIKLNYTNNYLTEIEMVEYMSKNDINALFYDNIEGVGVSAAIDYLISAQKPILISDSQQFRNFSKIISTYPNKGFKYIVDNYDKELTNIKNIYINCTNVLKDTEEIINKILC